MRGGSRAHLEPAQAASVEARRAVALRQAEGLDAVAAVVHRHCAGLHAPHQLRHTLRIAGQVVQLRL